MIFALGLHPILCQVADVLAYADNVFIVGPVNDTLTAAADFKGRLPAATLQLNDKESDLLCRQSDLDGVLHPFEVISGQVRGQTLCFPVAQEGIMALGCPIGSDSYILAAGSSVIEDIENELEAIIAFPYHHHRAKIVTFGTNARFPYHSR